jgi:hypothetical protein
MQCEMIEFQNFYVVLNFEGKGLFRLPLEAQVSRRSFQGASE